MDSVDLLFHNRSYTLGNQIRLEFRKMPCGTCSDFMTAIPITTNKSLKATYSLIQKRGLRYLDQGISVEIDPSGKWPDWIDEYFVCHQCKQVFYLHVEIYHGSGGALEPISETAQSLSERRAASKAAAQMLYQSNSKSSPTKKAFWDEFSHTFVRFLLPVVCTLLGIKIVNLLFQLFSR